MSQNSKDGRLQIISSPHSDVIIDGKPAGKTPFEASFVEGDHNVKLIVSDETASQAAIWESRVQVFKNTRTFVSREIGSNDLTSSGVIMTVQKSSKDASAKNKGRIEIQTEPDGSIVSLDDEQQGITPLILSDVPEGDHELSVSSPGFFRRSQKVKVQAGYTIFAEYKLAIDPSHKKIEKEESPKDATSEAELKTSPTPSPSTSSTQVTVSIKDTGTGFLRVRSEPSVAASESARIKPGDVYTVLEEKSGWYRIEYSKGNDGWISAQYATKQ